jgi:hypothetical protein
MNTIDRLRNGEIRPEDVKYGRSQPNNSKETALKADLINNGYDEAGANEYIKKAKAAGKL